MNSAEDILKAWTELTKSCYVNVYKANKDTHPYVSIDFVLKDDKSQRLNVPIWRKKTEPDKLFAGDAAVRVREATMAQVPAPAAMQNDDEIPFG